jgi:hypothetical protein
MAAADAAASATAVSAPSTSRLRRTPRNTIAAAPDNHSQLYLG